uniref:Flagellar hook-basal body complex protein FliE n=1 Tax=Glossina austeni TaxID=7395 RepID=A0A1A9UKM4_GLOAU
MGLVYKDSFRNIFGGGNRSKNCPELFKTLPNNSIPNGSNLVETLPDSIKKINTLELQAENISKKFEIGNQNIGINDVMLEMQKASIALNFGIQVTNKLIGAYQEIMNMNV